MEPRIGAHGDWPRAIVFDLDGTLLDSAPDIQRAINAAFAPLGVPAFELATVKAMIGGGAPAAIAKAAALAGLSLSTSEARVVLDRFYPVYASASGEGRGLYPGAHALLERLARAGVRLAICTNKAQPVTDIAVRALGIDTYFQAVVGARDDLPKKPHPAPVLEALAALGVAAADALMVGDSAADVGAAKAAGVAIVALAHGYAGSPADALGADGVAQDLVGVDAAITALRTSRTNGLQSRDVT